VLHVLHQPFDQVGRRRTYPGETVSSSNWPAPANSAMAWSLSWPVLCILSIRAIARLKSRGPVAVRRTLSDTAARIFCIVAWRSGGTAVSRRARTVSVAFEIRSCRSWGRHIQTHAEIFRQPLVRLCALGQCHITAIGKSRPDFATTCGPSRCRRAGSGCR